MAYSVRMFLLTGQGLRHLSRRLMQELYNDQPVLPEYAGTRQRVAEVVIEFKDKKPQRITRIRAYWYAFDDRGGLVRHDWGRASPSFDLSEVERKLVYAAVFGKNVISL